MKPTKATRQKPKNLFPVRIFTDLSTFHITKEDGQLLEHVNKNTPYVCGDDPQGYGTWFWVPTPKDWVTNDARTELLKYGFSDAFCTLLARISDAGIPYVHFDRDGEIVEELPQFEW